MRRVPRAGIVRVQSFMRRRMIAAAVEQRPDIRHIDGEHDGAQAAPPPFRLKGSSSARFRTTAG